MPKEYSYSCTNCLCKVQVVFVRFNNRNTPNWTDSARYFTI